MNKQEFKFESEEEKIRLQSLIRSLLDKNGNPNKLKKKSLLREEDETKLLEVSGFDDLNVAMYSILHEKKGFCEICKTPIFKLDGFQKGFRKVCSNSCAGKMGANEIERKNMELYGVKHHNQLSESNEKRAKTNLERYGAKTYVASKEGKEKIKKNNLEKRGVDHHMKDKEFVRNSGYNEKWSSEKKQAWSEKTEQTNLERRGVKHHQSTKDWKDKMIETMQSRYGVSNFSKTEEFKTGARKFWSNLSEERRKAISEKAKETCLKRYGVENYLLSKDGEKQRLLNSRKHLIEEVQTLTGDLLEEFLENVSKHLEFESLQEKHQFVSELLGFKEIRAFNNFLKRNGLSDWNLHSTGRVSSQEVSVYLFLKELGLGETIKRCDRKFSENGSELDLLVGEILAIEIDGLPWHTEEFGRDSEHHLEKTLNCMKKGCNLIHIYDFEWNQKRKICESLISKRLGLVKTLNVQNLKEISLSETEAKKFFNSNGLDEFDENCETFKGYETEEGLVLVFAETDSHIFFCEKIGINIVDIRELKKNKLFKLDLRRGFDERLEILEFTEPLAHNFENKYTYWDCGSLICS